MKHLLLFTLFLLKTTQLFAQIYPELVVVPAGEFLMGDSLSEPDSPRHWVKLDEFKIAKTETTVWQWKQFCQETSQPMPQMPPWGWQDNHPIVNVSWNDAGKYLQWLGKKTGKNYRLPTEAEWEYAARAAVKKSKNAYSGASEPDQVAWFLKNSDEQTHVTGSKTSSALGLFDMSGNVAEWCQDVYGSYPTGRVTNPTGPSAGFFRIVRGGSWYNTALRCTVTFREKYASGARIDYIGFRIVEF